MSVRLLHLLMASLHAAAPGLCNVLNAVNLNCQVYGLHYVCTCEIHVLSCLLPPCKFHVCRRNNQTADQLASDAIDGGAWEGMQNMDVSFFPLCFFAHGYIQLHFEPAFCINGLENAFSHMHTEAVFMPSKESWLVL